MQLLASTCSYRKDSPEADIKSKRWEMVIRERIHLASMLAVISAHLKVSWLLLF